MTRASHVQRREFNLIHGKPERILCGQQKSVKTSDLDEKKYRKRPLGLRGPDIDMFRPRGLAVD